VLIEEARWIGARLAAIPDDELFPLLNVGSSTLAYRTVEQPHLQQEIFGPLSARGGKVWHTDVKPDPGVDVVGDFMQPEFVAELGRLGARSLLVANVLQHVADPVAVATALAPIVPAGGFVVAAVPRQFPYTDDPFDNMFRPDVQELAAVFPGTELVEGAEVSAGAWGRWNPIERGRTRTRFALRLLTPFYRPRRWLLVARQAPYVVRPATATVVVLRKP
jgi:hypothetical protein